MRLEWVLLAEGAGTNAAGAVTVISINANVVPALAFPVTTKRVVVGHFVAAPGEVAAIAGKDLSVTVRIMSPSGEPMFVQTITTAIAAPPYPNLPSGLDVAMDVAQLRITEYGVYEALMSAQIDSGDVMEGRAALYVTEPPVAAVLGAMVPSDPLAAEPDTGSPG